MCLFLIQRHIDAYWGIQISLDLYLPASKRFSRSIELYGPINPGASSYKYFGTKVCMGPIHNDIIADYFVGRIGTQKARHPVLGNPGKD